ncbi:hypothetical protein D9758_005164 [Tetrapyrgos nigripes]|uniref:Uncharacterized protein n=1 Tax=Tetrapyrgos nigripes TaxID=182062 RepID=A0A8H5GWM0_9AGAR|nr:hypothetical protein D9758_005164 [Tetrapyrgos nigripes]
MVSPSLKSALFHLCEAQDVHVFLSAAREKAPMLQSLTIISPRISSLDLGYLSQLQNLQSLDFGYAVTVKAHVAESVVPVQFPQSLKQLKLHGGQIVRGARQLFDVLEIYRASEIESLYIGGIIFRADLERMFSVLSSQWSCTITNLTLQLLVPKLLTNMDQTPNLILDFIRPLFSLQSLRVFEAGIISIRWLDVCIMDTLITDICNTWPQLTKLQICSNGFEELPTVESLKTLSQLCLDLERVTVPFNIVGVPSVHFDNDSTTYLSSSSHKLKCFTVIVEDDNTLQEFLINSSRSLAYHLDLSFPYLKDVYIKPHSGAVVLSWSKVMDIIRLCQDARSGEEKQP